jgi:excisionase family DNA binding protein
MTDETGEKAATMAGQAYLDVPGLAAYLRVSVNTIRHWRKRGILPPACKLGRLVRWPRVAIDQWAAARNEATRKRREIDVRLGQMPLALRRH